MHSCLPPPIDRGADVADRNAGSPGEAAAVPSRENADGALAIAATLAHGCAPPPFGLDPAFYARCTGELGLGDRHCAEVAAWRLPAALPADDERAASLGRAIFFDEGFASVPGVSCASCHRPLSGAPPPAEWASSP